MYEEYGDSPRYFNDYSGTFLWIYYVSYNAFRNFISIVTLHVYGAAVNLLQLVCKFSDLFHSLST